MTSTIVSAADEYREHHQGGSHHDYHGWVKHQPMPWHPPNQTPTQPAVPTQR